MGFKQVMTPYNFVPLWDTVIRRYSDQKELPAHDVQRPDLLHGEITVKITAETPIFISDISGKDARGKAEFVSAGGTAFIPGSSLRGLIRTNMQILGFGDIASRTDYDNTAFRSGDSFSEGIPSSHLESERWLDYPRSMMGFILYGSAKKDENGAYRSRVSFHDLHAAGNPLPKKSRVNVWLRAPRPYSFREYAVKTGSGFRMRGIKQYWLRAQSQRGGNVRFDREGNMHPLPEGTVFIGKIRYHNLHEDELGLLLWCLRLEKGCCQSLGMGKPYGFGRVRIEVTQLTEYSSENLYSGLTLAAPSSASPEKRVEELICAYRRYAYSLLYPQQQDASGLALLKEPHIQDFLYMKKTIHEDAKGIQYMRKEDFRTADIPLATVAEIRSKGHE